MARTVNSRTRRDMARLLADFGHDLPKVPQPAPGMKEPRLFRHAAGPGSSCGHRGLAFDASGQRSAQGLSRGCAGFALVGVDREKSTAVRRLGSASGTCEFPQRELSGATRE
jgi:hypothetical protein